MGRIKTGGRGFEFSRREIEIAWDDTKAELDEESRRGREKAKSINTMRSKYGARMDATDTNDGSKGGADNGKSV